MNTLADDLMLLQLDDRGRSRIGGTELPLALAGAVLLELTNDGYVRITGDGEQVRRGRLVAAHGAGPADPIARTAFELIRRARRPLKPKDAVTRIGRGLRRPILDRLEANRQVRMHRDRVLGLVPRRSWIPAGPRRAEVLAPIDAALRNDRVVPDPRTAALIALLSAVGAATKVVPGDRRAVKARAARIADGDWAAGAVRDSVQAATAAIAAATAAASAGASS